MKKRIISLILIILYMNIALHTYAAAELTWKQEVQLGEPILIYHNDTLLYNITIDIRKGENQTYALIRDSTGKFFLEKIDWNPVNLPGNVSIVSTRKNITSKTALVIISVPDDYRISYIYDIARQTNTTNSANQTIANATNTTNTTAPTANITANLTPVVIPQNVTCNSTEECQAIIANLTAQLKKVQAERDELAKQIEYLQRQLNMTTTEKKQLEEQLKILQKALDERNRQIRELQEEIERLKAQQWSWDTFREKSEEQYLLWTPYFFPAVLAGLTVYYRRYKRTKKYMDVKVDIKAKELKEELLSEYLKKDILKAKIETIVDDPNLLVILRTIIPQLTGSQEITKGDILSIDIDQVAELARKKFLLRENRVEYLKAKLAELKEKIKEEAGENV